MLASSRIWVFVFFGSLFGLGVKITPDYGVYIDEFTNHIFGLTWYDYARGVILQGEPIAPQHELIDHDVVHGPVFEMAVGWFGREILELRSLAAWVLYRHYATWGIFYLSVVVVFLLGRGLGASTPIALLGSLFLVIHPRIFSHSFYDSVDISFLAFYVCSVFTLVRYLDRRSLGALSLHAMMCAMAIGVRSIGGIIPAITMVVLVVELAVPRNGIRSWAKGLGRLVWFPTLVAFTTFATWPFLWNHPIERIQEIIRLTPQVGWGGTVLYRGETILAAEVPWHYLPTWIGITTPLVIIVFFLMGLVSLVALICRNPLTVWQERSPELVVFAATFAPIALVILMSAEIYDGWRHLFFIYPTFALIAMMGLQQCISWIDTLSSHRAQVIVKATGVVWLAPSLMHLGWTMIELHPYQNVYFNRLAGKDLVDIKPRFEADFWGLSYIEGLRHLVKTHPTGPIKIYHGQHSLLAINRLVLPEADQARIEQVEFEDADFVLTIYRTHRQGFPELEEIYSVERDGAKIMSVYRTGRSESP